MPFAIVDEVDSILIDEARTPLIISGPAENNVDQYLVADKIILISFPRIMIWMRRGRTVSLSETGIEHARTCFCSADAMGEGTLYDIDNVGLLHHVNQVAARNKLFQRDSHYMVKNAVVIIDEFTGRAMEGRHSQSCIRPSRRARVWKSRPRTRPSLR